MHIPLHRGYADISNAFLRRHVPIRPPRFFLGSDGPTDAPCVCSAPFWDDHLPVASAVWVMSVREEGNTSDNHVSSVYDE